MPVGIGLVATNTASNRASGVAKDAAGRADLLEQQKFEESKRQAEILRQRGDEAAAVALEEGARAELGAARYEALSNQYAQQAESGAARLEQAGFHFYDRIKQGAESRAAAGQQAQSAILGASGQVRGAASDTDRRLTQANQQGQGYLTDAFGNISERYSPFIDSERRARGQLDVEMGLSEGDVNRDYRDTSAYMAAQDASRVAQEESIAAIDQAAGNSGTLYSGTRGAALSDRAGRGSYERAGIEQNYYQNYMNMLQSMANPASTNTLSGFEANTAQNRAGMEYGTAQDISSAYMNAAGTGLNAEMAARQIGLDTMMTGAEGSELLPYMNSGTAGAPYALSGFDAGTAGSPYRLQAQDYRTNAAGNAAGMITGNIPTGTAGSNYRFAGVEAQNAALADMMGAGTNAYSAYMMYGPGSASGVNSAANTRPGYGPSYNTPYEPSRVAFMPWSQ